MNLCVKVEQEPKQSEPQNAAFWTVTTRTWKQPEPQNVAFWTVTTRTWLKHYLPRRTRIDIIFPSKLSVTTKWLSLKLLSLSLPLVLAAQFVLLLQNHPFTIMRCPSPLRPKEGYRVEVILRTYPPARKSTFFLIPFFAASGTNGVCPSPILHLRYQVSFFLIGFWPSRILCVLRELGYCVFIIESCVIGMVPETNGAHSPCWRAKG